jgi:hypothetical protein
VVKVENVLLSGRYHNDLNRYSWYKECFGWFQPKVIPKNYKACWNCNHASSVLDQMETKPKLVVLDTWILDGLCFTRIIRSNKTCRYITNDEEDRPSENIL